jgi:hypothetical protein
MRRAVLLLLVLLAGCEPAPDFSPPAREEGQVALDEAGILDEGVAERLREMAADGRDVVALTYETEEASRGEASRAGRLLIEEWGADIVLVAVARPGDFTSAEDERERFFGMEAADTYDIPRDLREQIVEGRVPPVAGENDWPGAFRLALDELDSGLEP